MGAHVKTCDRCGREGTRGYTKVGHGFALRGRTRTAQLLNMRSGPAIWECAPGMGCQAPAAKAAEYKRVHGHYPGEVRNA